MKHVLDSARQYAVNSRNPVILPQHLLMAMTDGNVSPATVGYIDSDMGAGSSSEINHALSVDEFQTEQAPVTNVTVSVIVDRLIKLSMLEARMLKATQVSPVHLLLAMLHNSEVSAMPFMKQLTDRNFIYQKLYSRVATDAGVEKPQMGGDFADDDEWDDNVADNSRSENKSQSQQDSASKSSGSDKHDTPVLDKFGVDMTRAAAEGRLDPVVGREVEIERLAQILSRRKEEQSGAYRRTGRG